MFLKFFYLLLLLFLFNPFPVFSLKKERLTSEQCGESLEASEEENQNSGSINEEETQKIHRLEEALKEWEARPVKEGLNRELKIPPKREFETLEAQGFDLEHIKGIDEMVEMIAVGKQWREWGLDPDVHSDYLAGKMKQHIQFMEEGVRNPGQRQRLKLLKEYGEKAVEEKRVSYEKYIKFNAMLAKALGHDKFGIGASIEDHIAMFPKIILLPTIEGIVGYITMTDGIDADIYVHGLTNEELTEYDGIQGDSFDVFDHDLLHTMRIINAKHRNNTFFYKIMKLVGEKIKHLPFEKRKDLEIARWSLMHEIPLAFPSFIREDLMQELPSLYRKKKIQKSNKEIQEIVDEFMEIYKSVFKTF